jgi:hypothetical protein
VLKFCAYIRLTPIMTWKVFCFGAREFNLMKMKIVNGPWGGLRGKVLFFFWTKGLRGKVFAFNIMILFVRREMVKRKGRETNIFGCLAKERRREFVS